MSTTADKITQVCDGIKQMLLDKNASYGDSASDPIRIFSQADKLEAIRVRIDDKLSRIMRGAEFQDEDTIRDLTGYLLLYMANMAPDAPAEAPAAPLRYKDRDGDYWQAEQVGHSIKLVLVERVTGKVRPESTAYFSYDEIQRNHGPLLPASATDYRKHA